MQSIARTVILVVFLSLGVLAVASVMDRPEIRNARFASPAALFN